MNAAPSPSPLEPQSRLLLRERQLKAVHDISIGLSSVADVDALLQKSLALLLETVDADAGSLLLYDPERKVLTFDQAVGPRAHTLLGMQIDPNDPHGRAAAVFRSGQALITANTDLDDYDTTVDERSGYHTESMLTIPLKYLDGVNIGILQALNKREGAFTEEDKNLLEIVGAIAAVSIVNARLAEEAKLAAVARAVGDLSHDIKNALTPIETMVDTTIEAFVQPMFEEIDRLAAECEGTDPGRAQALRDAIQPLQDWTPEMRGSVQDGCADIREMVSEIADYIKGAQVSNMEPGNVGDVIRERLRRLTVIAGNRRVKIHTEIEPDMEPFPFDRRLLGRAIFNLVNNALLAINEAVKKGKLELRPAGFNVRVKVSKEMNPETGGPVCLIEVQDDGPGIPDRVRESLFTAQTISTTPGGTGIGTRFVRSVADAHGGSVGVESRLGEGARFWMRLPMDRPGAAPAGA